MSSELYGVRSNGMHGSQFFAVVAGSKEDAMAYVEFHTGLPCSLLECESFGVMLETQYNGIAELCTV